MVAQKRVDGFEHGAEDGGGMGRDRSVGDEAGLRCGEIMALEWGDIDLANRQLSRARSERTGHVTMPKARTQFVAQRSWLQELQQFAISGNQRVFLLPGPAPQLLLTREHLVA